MASDAARALADAVSASVLSGLAQRPTVTVAVPGGRSGPLLMRSLAARKLPWDRVALTLTDERCVPADSPDSNEAGLRAAVAGTPAAAARIVGLAAAGGAATAARSTATLPRPYCTAILGMGEDGHVASLFPDEPLALDGPEFVETRAPVPPHERVSLSAAALASASGLFVFAGGPAKLARLNHAADERTPIGQILALRPDIGLFAYRTEASTG